MTGQTVTYRSYLAAICCVNRCTVSVAGRQAMMGTHARMSRPAPPHNHPAPDMASPISPTAREHHQGEQASWGGPGGTHVFRHNREGSSSRTSPACPLPSAPLECLRQQQCHNACTSQWVRGNRVLLPVSPSCPSQQVAIRFCATQQVLARKSHHFPHAWSLPFPEPSLILFRLAVREQPRKPQVPVIVTS